MGTLTAAVPARPLNMAAIEATNRGVADMAWAMLTAMPDVPQLEVEEVERRSPEAVVLDVREPQEYAHGHVPGALNLPQAELASRMNEVPRDRPVLVICQSGYRALRSAQFLRQMGFEHVANVKGGTAAWQASGKPLAVGDTSLDKPRIAESEWVHAGGAPTMSGAQ